MAIYDTQDPVNGQWWCVDATRAYGTLGRLINHSSKPNLVAKAARIDQVLRIGFLALRPIDAGDELTYSYGNQRNPPPWMQRY